MSNIEESLEAYSKGDGLYYSSFEFSAINFNYYFDVLIDTKTNPVTIVYVANDSKDTNSIGESYFSYVGTRFYSETPIPPQQQ